MQRQRSGEGDDRKVVAGGTLLGVGLGGFIDGIVLHQILQWHNMLSSKVPPTTLETMKYNMIFDGLFHAFTWLVTLAGVVVVFRAGMRREPFVPRMFTGALSLGWGLFNLIEGVVDHQLLGLHHVHPGIGQLAWDLGFLASGVVLITVGAALIRSGRQRGTKALRSRVPVPA